MTHRLVFSPEALTQLTELYRYIANAASPSIADSYTQAILNHCEGLCVFPHIGTLREDIRPGLRIIHHKKRTVIAYLVDAEQVSILGVFYGGQNHEAMLQEDADTGSLH
jgi:toxin ParE1/3/4